MGAFTGRGASSVGLKAILWLRTQGAAWELGSGQCRQRDSAAGAVSVTRPCLALPACRPVPSPAPDSRPVILPYPLAPPVPGIATVRDEFQFSSVQFRFVAVCRCLLLSGVQQFSAVWCCLLLVAKGQIRTGGNPCGSPVALPGLQAGADCGGGRLGGRDREAGERGGAVRTVPHGRGASQYPVVP